MFNKIIGINKILQKNKTFTHFLGQSLKRNVGLKKKKKYNIAKSLSGIK